MLEIIPANLVIVFAAAALAGFSISAFIFVSKNKKGPLVCPFGTECSTVVESKFSTTFGIRNEAGGMIYYALVAAGAVFLAVVGVPAEALPAVRFAVRCVTAAPALFSIYLFSVQAFILRAWCSWCLASAALSLLIAAAAFFI